jgi:hypothetical protein
LAITLVLPKNSLRKKFLATVGARGGALESKRPRIVEVCSDLFQVRVAHVVYREYNDCLVLIDAFANLAVESFIVLAGGPLLSFGQRNNL